MIFSILLSCSLANCLIHASYEINLKLKLGKNFLTVVKHFTGGGNFQQRQRTVFDLQIWQDRRLFIAILDKACETIESR